MKILVLNSGSSSLKFELFDMSEGESLLEGLLERIGEQGTRLVDRSGDSAPRSVTARDHEEAVGAVLDALSAKGALDHPEELAAVGHRVVHGGHRFVEPTLIDDEALSGIEAVSHLAPLHNPANIAGIRGAKARIPDAPHVAVFDTAFHKDLPPHAYRYAVPREWYLRHGVRRYGFHGTSHRFVSRRAAEMLGRSLDSLDLITLHLGNGASATAVSKGRSVDTSMGMTPLEGLVMGTRTGDLDASIPLRIAEADGLGPERTLSALNHDSGLAGICGVNDMREIHRRILEGDDDAALAFDLFCYRVKKYVGAYMAVLGGADAIVFTGGIGENDAEVRSQVCAGMESLGIRIDEHANSAVPCLGRIDAGSAVAVLVVPTDEELEIALQAHEVVQRIRKG